ncbi:MAG: hydantoinase B/oxoprolinase family protein, partial [Planctomycetota bacterium]|nr:hydantoinase B/oxoprolinase family protein [Planctomycetota bacterium]
MDPIQYEVMRSAFVAAAEEMGAALRRAAYSTNIKTRADFSCALFDSKLRLIAQSFSQPVHLASMSRMVPTAVRKYGEENLGPGDALVMNHPYLGGVHLNDVSIIAPFFSGEKRLGY